MTDEQEEKDRHDAKVVAVMHKLNELLMREVSCEPKQNRSRLAVDSLLFVAGSIAVARLPPGRQDSGLGASIGRFLLSALDEWLIMLSQLETPPTEWESVNDSITLLRGRLSAVLLAWFEYLRSQGTDQQQDLIGQAFVESLLLAATTVWANDSQISETWAADTVRKLAAVMDQQYEAWQGRN